MRSNEKEEKGTNERTRKGRKKRREIILNARKTGNERERGKQDEHEDGRGRKSEEAI